MFARGERGGIAGPHLFARAGLHVLPGIDAICILPVERGEFSTRESPEVLIKGFPEDAPLTDHLAISTELKVLERIVAIPPTSHKLVLGGDANSGGVGPSPSHRGMTLGPTVFVNRLRHARGHVGLNSAARSPHEAALRNVASRAPNMLRTPARVWCAPWLVR